MNHFNCVKHVIFGFYHQENSLFNYTNKKGKVFTLPFGTRSKDLSGDDHLHRERDRVLILQQKLREFQRFQRQKLSLDQQVGS